jgi:hypothetical protein
MQMFVSVRFAGQRRSPHRAGNQMHARALIGQTHGGDAEMTLLLIGLSLLSTLSLAAHMAVDAKGRVLIESSATVPR